MILIELFASKGSLNQEQRDRLSERLVKEVMRADNAPAAMMERARALTYVVVHEPDLMAGGLGSDSSGKPNYLVRVTVPAEHSTDVMRAEIITRITRVLAEAEEDPKRLYREPAAWIQLIEVPDGNLGVYGQVTRIGDLMKMVVTEHYQPAGRATDTDEKSKQTLIDPICGMSVTLDEHAITLDRDGTIYAFCSTACRDLFLSQGQMPHSVPIS